MLAPYIARITPAPRLTTISVVLRRVSATPTSAQMDIFLKKPQLPSTALASSVLVVTHQHVALQWPDATASHFLRGPLSNQMQNTSRVSATLALELTWLLAPILKGAVLRINVLPGTRTSPMLQPLGVTTRTALRQIWPSAAVPMGIAVLWIVALALLRCCRPHQSLVKASSVKRLTRKIAASHWPCATLSLAQAMMSSMATQKQCPVLAASVKKSTS